MLNNTDNRFSRTMESFDCISSDSEEGLLDEIIVGCNFQAKQLQRIKHHYRQQQQELNQQQHNHHHEHTHNTSHHVLAIGYYHSQPYLCQKSQYDTMESPIHYCDNTTHVEDDSSKELCSTQKTDSETRQQQDSQQQQEQAVHPMIRFSATCDSDLSQKAAVSANRGSICSSESATSITGTTIISHEDTDQSSITTQLEMSDYETVNLKENGENLAANHSQPSHSQNSSSAAASSSSAAGTSFTHQLTADMCNFKNSKSRRLEYSLKCLKYARSNPSQDSAFGSLTDNDLSTSSFRLSSFQSISSPIDEGVEDVIIATTTAGQETCLELATIPRNMVSQDSAISSPCRETSPSNFLNVDEGSCSGASSSSGSTGNLRPQHFPVSLSPKILVTATTNSSNSSLASASGSQTSQAQPQPNQTQQFDPPKILVNDQNSIYTTSPSKKSGTIEVFSQKYRVSSFEDMSPLKKGSNVDKQHLKNVNRLAFRSLEEERRIDNAFMPITDRVHSDNRVNVQSEKYKKLTHASFRISKTSSQVITYDTSPGQTITSSPGSSTMLPQCGTSLELKRPATASGSSNSRQTMWRDSKFYRKNRIAKSNDSLLEASPNHSARLSPSSFRDNHYDSSSSYGSRSHSRQSLNRGGSIHEIMGSSHTLGPEITVTTSFCNNPPNGSRRYCSSKSEDLGDSSDYLRVMDVRKSYSERHLVTFETTLKQTAINNTMPLDGSDQCYLSEDDTSFNEDNNVPGGQYQNQNIPPAHSNKQRSQSRHQQVSTKSKYGCGEYYQQQSQQSVTGNSNKSGSYTRRSHPNQLSWSSLSINHLKTTNIKTTSLAALSCQQNLTNTTGQHQHQHHSSSSSSSCHLDKPSPSTSSTPSSSSNALSLDTTSRSPKKSSRNPVFKTLLNTATSNNNTDTSSENCSRQNSLAPDNSSPDDSPTRRSLSGIELAKIFSMDSSTGSGGCSEEKTPLLDSVEMSPISPTDPDNDDDDDDEENNVDGLQQRADQM